jgi:hypothetical protein
MGGWLCTKRPKNSVVSFYLRISETGSTYFFAVLNTSNPPISHRQAVSEQRDNRQTVKTVISEGSSEHLLYEFFRRLTGICNSSMNKASVWRILLLNQWYRVCFSCCRAAIKTIVRQLPKLGCYQNNSKAAAKAGLLSKQ